MMIHVTQEAAEWFKRELDLKNGQAVRFFARYSSGGKLYPGFSLGIGVDRPVSPALTSEVEGITFYMEDQDKWYLDGYHLNVTYDEGLGDIEYKYEAALPN
ncbi:hypothetical protein P4H94_29500 [Paenibacillus macerans]|uniref:Uncharacterized protein n=1 Tax=Paenibacillus macerans TaxID=44252 RepID=A0A6N8ETA3_PAEMA|nr:hypothetical protein [Paenibacillus macerans]MBS5909924.1 hypothetical protein [Paenibacillus macerans]MCM3699039.1 hypothetical protein [Paenibacillus macerans]MDU5949490.1 hypothetical protein [Paenibacillus macerans]MEC0140979.1 hypothetical protein [Paenibacillus macerans]MUG21701.1 hypothetical protein [Paenibacillus macerans]